MIVRHKLDNSVINFIFTVEETDISLPSHINLLDFKIILPNSIVCFEDIHPDVWAIIVILNIFKYLGNHISFSFSISPLLFLFFSRFNIDIEPVSLSISQRQPTTEKHGVCFSGGINSLVTSLLFNPSDVVLSSIFFMNDGNNQNTDYLMLMNDLITISGYKTILTLTDCNRNGHPFLCSMGLLLLLETLKIGTIHFGFTNRDSYSIRSQINHIYTKNGSIIYGNQYTNYTESFMFWTDLFNVIGVNISFPISSINNVMTTLIVDKIPNFREYVSRCKKKHSDDMNCNICFMENTIKKFSEFKDITVKQLMFNGVLPDIIRIKEMMDTNTIHDFNIMMMYLIKNGINYPNHIISTEIVEQKENVLAINNTAYYTFAKNINQELLQSLQKFVRFI